MVRVLKAVCMLFTATVVLFVLVNFLVAYIYPRDTRAVVSGHPVFNVATRATYEREFLRNSRGTPLSTTSTTPQPSTD